MALSVDRPFEASEFLRAQEAQNTAAIIYGAVENAQHIANFPNLTSASSPEDIIRYAAYVSNESAIDGVMPVPPTARHYEAMKREGRGPSRWVIDQTLGISGAQEAIGFITANKAREMTPEDMTTNGKWLANEVFGTPEHPVMPETKDLRVASQLGIGPAVDHILDKFDRRVDKYQDSLGFVTQATVERWTDQDWIDHAIWLTHTAGSPEEPAPRLTEAIVNAASKARIGVSEDFIKLKFGSITNYWHAVEKSLNPDTPDRLDYEYKSREWFVENGKWFSHAIGSPEHPVMPTRPTIDEGNKLGLIPPLTALTKRFKGSIPVYQDSLGFVTSATLERWTDEEWAENAVWLRHAAGTPENPADLTKELVLQASALDLGPTLKAIKDKYPGGLAEYQRLAGHQEVRRDFSGWSERMFLQRGLQVLKRTGWRRPRQEEFEEYGSLTRPYIVGAFGNIRNYWEKLGVPDLRGATKEECIAIALSWTHENDGVVPDSSHLKELYQYGKLPSISKIYALFGDVPTFTSAIEERYPAYAELCQKVTTDRGLPACLAPYILSDYRPTPEYAEQSDIRGREIRKLLKTGLRSRELVEIFRAQPITAGWDADNFAYFGANICDPDKVEDVHGQVAQTIGFLHEINLSPSMEEIIEVFESFENFILALKAERQDLLPAAKWRSTKQ